MPRSSFLARTFYLVRASFLIAASAMLALPWAGARRADAQTVHFGASLTLGSGFLTPTGVAVDAYGNVFVVDQVAGVVKEMEAVNGTIPASPVIRTLGSGFYWPYTAAVDGSGNVFLTDDGHQQVKEIVAVNGVIPPSPTIRVLGSGFSKIYGTALDANGDLFVADYGHHEVKEMVALNGVIPAFPKILVLGSGLWDPLGLALDPRGNLVVSDGDDGIIKEILASGGYTKTITIATGLNTPTGVAVDQDGNIYFAEANNNLVKEILAVNGSIPASPTIVTLDGAYYSPSDVAVDLKGNVYVADSFNSAVKEIVRAGANFGQVNVLATSSSAISLPFTFDTAGTLGSISVVTQGNTGWDFFNNGDGSCVAGQTYNAGDVCTVNVKFTPEAPGPRYGAVELLGTGGNLLATGPVQGIGVGPQVNFARTVSGVTQPGFVVPVGSGFSGPAGLAVDVNGNVFVADSYNNAVEEVLASSGWKTVKPLGSGFSYPNSVAVDGAGNVYVADTFNDAVKEILAVGGATVTLGSGFSNPYGVAVDGLGNVYVADFANGAVEEMIALNGVIPATPIIRTLAGGLNGPDGVAVDGSGNVFVAVYGDGTVEEIQAVNGAIPPSPTIKTIATGFSGPSNLAVDANADVFVTDSGDGEVDEIMAAGGYATVKIVGFGYLFPEAVAVDENGDLLIGDTGNNNVNLLDYADPPSLAFATTPGGATSSDSPRTIEVSNAGNATLHISTLTYPADFPEAPDVATDCHASSDLPTENSCTLSIDFSPLLSSATGPSTPLSESIGLTDNNLNTGNATQAVPVSGTETATHAVLLSPTPGTVLPGTNVTFTWNAFSGATSYILRLGTTPGGYDIRGTGNITKTSITFSPLPINGETIYARLYTVFASSTIYADYVFTAASETKAVLISPAPNSTLASSNVTFTWTAGIGATSYNLRLGTTVGGNDIRGGNNITGTSITYSPLPTNGETIYARLYTLFSGTTAYNDYVYTAANQAKAALISPAPNSTLPGSNVTFTWSTGAGASSYTLWLGTTVGGHDIRGTTTTSTSVNYAPLPTNGETIYVRLYTHYTSSSAYTDYVVTAAP